MATTDISRSLVRIRVAGSFLLGGAGPCGLMDKALPSGGRDCGFESRLGLFNFVLVSLTHKYVYTYTYTCTSTPRTTSWRNGNASDSRPEDWGFDSL